MNKAELISKISENTGFTKKDTEIVVTEMIDLIEESLVNGERVQLIGFGAFEVRDRKCRIGRNPKKPTEEVNIPESKAAVFKPGKSLKDKVNHK